MSTKAIIYAPKIDGARRQLQIFGVCTMMMSLLGIAQPTFLYKSVNPILELIGKHTGLACVRPPTTPREYSLNAFTFAFSLHIGCLYFIFSGPLWNRGGRVLAEAGIWTRMAYIVTAYALCFLTPYGSSQLVFTATYDIISVFHTKWAMGMSWADLIRGGTRAVSIDDTFR